jgi:prepilin-type N-terminal cleavage/methylation domain-containing protein
MQALSNQLTFPNRRLPRRDRGFSLVEILISLGLFAIGVTAVVSLFPAAAILQRETTQEVISEMAAQSAVGVIDAKQLTYAPGTPTGTGELTGYYSAPGYADTDAVPLSTVLGTVRFNNRLSAADRAYPSAQVNPFAGNIADAIGDADLYWVPFIQDLNGDPGSPNWVARLFLLESDTRGFYVQGNPNDANPGDPTNFPKVRRRAISNVNGNQFTLPGAIDVDPGDVVMDSNGNDHLVTEVNGAVITVLNPIAQFPRTPTLLWYAPKFGATSSPARRVVTVKIEPVLP